MARLFPTLRWNVKGTERYEFSDSGKHKKARTIAFILAIAAAATAFTYGIISLLSKDPGWTAITPRTETENTVAGDFSLQYQLGSDATAEFKQIQTLYTSACERAYAVFNPRTEFPTIADGTTVRGNVATMNLHPNEAVEVDPLLYEALEMLLAFDDRTIFQAPYFDFYDNLFHCGQDFETENFDPQQNEEVAAYFAEVSVYIKSPDDVSIDLLGGQTVRLNVSKAYLSYAQENGIDAFVDFYWMKNAFCCDYIASTLSENGFTNGFLVSSDGYTRNLDQRGTPYSMNVFEREPKEGGGYVLETVGTVQYTGPMALVVYKNYVQTDSLADHYYLLSDGTCRYPYLDEDGYPASTMSYLLLYSSSSSCAEIMLSGRRLYMEGQGSLADLSSRGIYGAYGENGTLISSAPEK